MRRRSLSDTLDVEQNPLQRESRSRPQGLAAVDYPELPGERTRQADSGQAAAKWNKND